MSVGAIVRTDQSGLGVQSRWAAHLLDVDAVVAVDLGKSNRGPAAEIDHPNVLRVRWDQPQRTGADRQIVKHFADCQRVWCAESWYWTALPRRLGQRRLHVHANPELWRPTGETNIRPALPTDWHAERLGYPVVPHPSKVGDPAFVALCETNVAREGPARRVLHMGAPAMLDRNGSQVMLAALSVYDGPPFTLVVGGSRFAPNHNAAIRGLDTQVHWPRRVNGVRVDVLDPVEDHASLYADVDLLVIPRRYAGQCLPAVEAASAGVPVLMSDVAPQDRWEGVDSSVHARKGQVHQMRGGRFHVAEPDPLSLAEALKRYTSDDGEHRRAWQEAACTWAVSLSWGNVKRRWLDWLAT